MLYLAYGSNMSHQRLRARTSGIQRLGITRLTGYRLMFHKIGHLDGTGKCDAFYTGKAEDCLFGVLYTIAAHEKRTLDAIEGLGNGYTEQQVTVPIGPDESALASLYIATHTDPDQTLPLVQDTRPDRSQGEPLTAGVYSSY